MKTIKGTIINEILINKSRFITILENIDSNEDFKEKLNKYKNQYKGANHYCYAYIINSYTKCSDDGEPAKTAGIPILNILMANNLTNVLCLVIRYFGGIKLGTGGLIRAYSKSAKEALDKATIAYLVDGYDIEIEFDYDNIKTVDYLLKNIPITKEFENKITYKFKISKEEYQKIENKLTENVKINKKEAIHISV